MIEIWTVLTPILLADVVNPVLFAFMVYAIGSNRPLRTAFSLLLVHTATYLVCGVVAALTLGHLEDRLANPHWVDFIVGFIVGLFLLWVAFRMARESERKEPEDIEELTPLKAFGLGSIINLIGLPFALPYFAALSQILKADLSVADSILLVTAYNLFYAVPFDFNLFLDL